MYQHHHPGYSKCQIDREDSKSNLLSSKNANQQSKIVETNVTLSSGGKYVNGIIAGKSEKNSERRNEDNNSSIDVEASPSNSSSSSRPSTLPLVNLKSKRSETNLSRQESLDKFNEIFSSSSNVALKDPHMRIKTPGDLPPSVRKVRGRSNQNAAARFSLYDDRIMCNIMSEEDDARQAGGGGRSAGGGVTSSSVPFGMDFADEQLTVQSKFDAKDVTCF